MLILGAHTIDNGGIHMAVRRAGSAAACAHCRSSLRQAAGSTTKRSPFCPERVERFKAALAETDIRPEHIVAHAAYVLSVATPDDEKYARATLGLTKEVERAGLSALARSAFTPGPLSTARGIGPGDAHCEGDHEGARDGSLARRGCSSRIPLARAARWGAQTAEEIAEISPRTCRSWAHRVWARLLPLSSRATHTMSEDAVACRARSVRESDG